MSFPSQAPNRSNSSSAIPPDSGGAPDSPTNISLRHKITFNNSIDNRSIQQYTTQRKSLGRPDTAAVRPDTAGAVMGDKYNISNQDGINYGDSNTESNNTNIRNFNNTSANNCVVRQGSPPRPRTAHAVHTTSIAQHKGDVLEKTSARLISIPPNSQTTSSSSSSSSSYLMSGQICIGEGIAMKSRTAAAQGTPG